MTAVAEGATTLGDTLTFLIEVRGGEAAVTQMAAVKDAVTDVAGSTVEAGDASALMSSQTVGLTKAQKDLSGASRGAEADLVKQKSAVSSLSSGMGGLVVAFGLFEGVKSVTTALKESQLANTQTTAALKSTGDASRETAAGISALARSQAQLTGTNSATIQGAENLLLTFTNLHQGVGRNNEVFSRATKAALDLATAMHTGPEQAAKMLGKALQEPEKGMTALTRAGLVLTSQQKEWIKGWVESGETLKAQDYLLGLVEQKVGGSADAYGKTLSGEIGRAKVAGDEFGESLATIVLPGLTSVATGLSSLFGWFAQLSPEVKKTIITLVLLAVGFAVVAKGIVGVREAWLALEAASVANPWMLAAMVLITIAVLVVEHWTRVRQALVIIWTWMENAGKNVAKAVSGFFTGMANDISGAFNWVVSHIESAWHRLESLPVLGGIIKLGIGAVGGLAHGNLGIPGLAEGGTVIRQGLVEVGERGPELLNLPKGATVEPLRPGSLGGGWGSGDIVIKIDGKTVARVQRRQTLLSQAAGA